MIESILRYIALIRLPYESNGSKNLCIVIIYKYNIYI